VNRREGSIACLFIAPAGLLLAAFVVWPAVNTVRTSLHRATLTGPGLGEYCGADKYRELIDDPQYSRSARNTALFTVLVVPIQSGLALLLAVWANGSAPSRRMLRYAVFAPTVISLTVLAVLWKLMYEPASATGAGLINGLLNSVGLSPQPFLSSARQALPAIVVMSIWQGIGLQMMIFLSGLQQIPTQLYEAAALDGAGAWRRFRHVTLPGIAPTAVFVVMVTTIFALKLFVQPFLMTRGGPEGSTMSVVQYIYETAFYGRDLGLACAAGAVFFVVVAVVAVLQRLLLRSAEVTQ
jgi:ABC-type sugar transport system permease subunit